MEGILSAGADPNLNDAELVYYAIEMNNHEMLNNLIKYGGDVLRRGEKTIVYYLKKSSENIKNIILKALLVQKNNGFYIKNVEKVKTFGLKSIR